MYSSPVLACFALFFTAANIPQVTPQATCPTGWKDFDGYCWYYSRAVGGADRKNSWSAAESFCQQNGGHLAIFSTVEQRDNAYDQVKIFDDTRWWIGLTDHEYERTFKWLDGTTPSDEISNWKRGEPSDTSGEDCVEMWVELPIYRGQWNDRSCDAVSNFICRKSPGEVASCDEGWITEGQGCYKVFTAQQQWAEADLTCRAEGGDLTAITTATEQNFLTNLIVGYTADFWTGLSDTDNPGTLQWSSQESFAYSNLASGQTQTNTPYRGSTCVELNKGLAYKWNEVKCSNERPFVCEKGFKATCPVGWTFLAGKCYELVVNPNRAATWPVAMQACKLLGAGLLKVQTADEQKYLAGVLEAYYNSGAQEIWLGGSDIGHDETFTWWDNTPIGTFYWDVNMPSKHPGRDDCMAIYSGNAGNSNWETSSCFHERQYICELPEGAKLPSGPGSITVDGKCETGWRWFQEKCYYFGQAEVSQPSAVSYCTQMSTTGYPSTLASVLNDYEISFIEGHLTGDSWIGLKITGDSSFEWIDGSPYSWENWATGKPGNPRDGDCVYARENSAIWEDAQCNDLHLFVCKKNEIEIPEVVITPPPTDPDTLKCGGNGWFSDPQSDRCYKINVEQTRSWNDARYQCERESGYLTAINSQQENDFLAAISQGLPFAANLWIGASDKMAFQDDVIDVIDGGWTWSDGSPFNFVNWNSGEPNNSGEEDCVELYVENGMWNDLNCANFRHFICEKIGNVSNIIGPDYTQTQCRSNEACCFKHLGVEKGGVIPDSALSASSVRNQNYNETRGRLNMQETILITDIGETHIGYHGAWEPGSDDQETSWYQVDFEDHNEMKGIITQGRNGYELNNERQWVTSFTVSYSQDPVNTKAAVKDWEFISDSTGAPVIFQGNRDKDTQVTNLFPQPIIARHVRCHPKTYYDRVAMRLEYIGCRASCLHKIGLNSGYIADDMITASSGDATQARAPVDTDECLPNSGDNGVDYRGWLAKTKDGVDCQPWALQTPHPHEETYQNYPNAGLIGNYCRNPNGKSRPWCYTMNSNEEWDYCDIPTCPTYTPTGWVSTSSATSQWVQVQFDTFYKVGGITTYAGTQYWVTKYVVQFSDTGGSFATYKNQAGSDHMFNGPAAQSTSYMDILREPLTTRFIRIVPKQWFGRIYLQFEINGCYADQRITCADKASQFDGDSLTINCPGGCVEDPNGGIVYGTDTYTESSSVCRAAIHAGRLNNQHGGTVGLTKTNGINSYLGSYRHGITSLSYSTAKQSIIFNGQAYRCADGWQGWNEHCYYFSPADVLKSWTEARAACKSLGGDLASIWSMAENDFLTTMIIQSFNGGKIWIGLNALDTGNLYQWSDGSPVTMTKWYLNEPNNGNEKCVQMYRANGYWNDKTCSSECPYLCKRQKQLLPPVTTIVPPTDDGCEIGWKGHEQSCYWTSPDTQPYYYAKILCEEAGAQLATIGDHYEQAFIHAHVTSNVPPNLGYTSWIGIAAKTGENGAQYYEWESGEEVAYTMWDQDQPYIWLKCHFPFVYRGQTYYECTTADNPIALLPNVPWCSATPVFGGALLYCGNGYAQECGFMDDRTGYWQMSLCTKLRYYTCEKPRIGYTRPQMTTFPYFDRPCADGWVGSETTIECYQINEMTDRAKRLTWQYAYDHCKAQNADLVSIHSSAEEIEIQGYVQKYGNATYSPFWIGLNSLSNSVGYSWSDGSGVGYTNWGDGEPNDHNGKENCVETQMTEGSRWNDVNCDALRNWICKIGKWRTPDPLPTLPPPQGTENSAQCGAGWIYYTTDYQVEKCYKFMDTDMRSWGYAERQCVEYGGHLVAIHSQDENTMILSRAARTKAGSLWIGLRDVGGRTFYWADESLTDYINWAPGEPNNYLTNEDCVEMSADGGLWNDDNCGLQKAYICEKCTNCQGMTLPPTPAATGYCPPGYAGFGNKCYFSSGPDLKYNFDDALEYCRNNSAELAVINNEYEQAFLTSHLWGDADNVWIGMSNRGGGSFVWMDQSHVTYTAWDGGQPDNWNSEEGCVEMWMGSLSSGRWNDHNCAEIKTFACYVRRSDEFDQQDPTDSPYNCPDGYYSWGRTGYRNCYRLVDQPASYDDASDNCRDKGDYLVHIAQVYENELLHSWFWRNVLPSTVSFWTGMTFSASASPNSSDSDFAWSNGWPVQYTNWGHNEPNNDYLQAGSGCVYMTKSGSWSTAPRTSAAQTTCSSTMSFVCKRTLDPIPTTPPPPVNEGICDTGFVGFKGQCYYVNVGATDETTRSWAEAYVECGHREADLASFHSDEEVDFFIESLNNAPSHNLFIGLYSNGFDGYMWSDGSPVDYLNWNSGEPNGQSGEECIEMYPWSGTWNDVDCFEGRGYVCKKPMDFTRCYIPNGFRYECGFPDITEQYCVSRRGCCWDGTMVTANFSGCFFSEGLDPSGNPLGPEPIGGLSGGAIAGIVIGVLIIVAIAGVGIYLYRDSLSKQIPAMPAFSVPSFKSKPAPPDTKAGGFDNPMSIPES